MNVIKELYVIEDNGKFILYAPLKRIILSVNKDVISLLMKIKSNEMLIKDEKTLQAIDYLRNLELIDSGESANFHNSTDSAFKPTRVTFLPTSDCNLKCIYCYADSGSTSKYLSFEIAKTALDFIFNNAKEKNVTQVHIGFLGGGEPFLAWELIKEIIEYSRIKADELGVSTYFGGVTNGMLSKEKTLWISENFQYLNISIDGMKSIHDKHRPSRDNNSSYDRIIKTLTLLNELGFKYSVRSTISSLSLNQMTSIVEFFTKELNVSRIHFEPLFACGRCKTNTELIPDPKVFADNFKKCIPIAHSENTELFCSAVRLDTLTTTFCGALGENFYITPEGYVTSCTEVSSVNEELSKMFFIGKFDENSNEFVFWNERKNFLSSRTVDKMQECQQCIAKWHCAGGCPAKAALKGNIFNPIRMDDCTISRELTEYYIKSLVTMRSNYLPQVNANYTEPFK